MTLAVVHVAAAAVAQSIAVIERVQMNISTK